MSSPSSSTLPLARRRNKGGCPAEQNVTRFESMSSRLRLIVMNFSSIPAAQNRLFSFSIASSGDGSVETQNRVSPENLAIIKAAATPLPETSPSAMPILFEGRWMKS